MAFYSQLPVRESGSTQPLCKRAALFFLLKYKLFYAACVFKLHINSKSIPHIMPVSNKIATQAPRY